MNGDVWVLGGAGRSGQNITAALRERGIEPVLVGRTAEKLIAVAGRSGQIVLAQSVDEIVAEIGRRHPAVVINTIAPFTESAAAIVATGVHYIDIANDAGAVSALLDRSDELVARGQTVVTGAGFGVTASESTLVKLLEGRSTPARVRVDMIPSLESEAGKVGESLATSLVSGLTFRDPHGSALASHPMRLTLPDGSVVSTASMPLGDAVAARHVSQAPSVIAGSSMAPTGAVRFALPVATALLAVPPVRAVARRLLARLTVSARPRPREYSWGHAHVEWPDGSVRDGWLRVGDASTFTGTVPAEIARRLLDGSGRPGAFTPAALFGPSLAEACGAAHVPGALAA